MENQQVDAWCEPCQHVASERIAVDGKAVSNARNEPIIEVPALEAEVFRGWVGMFDFLGFTEVLRHSEGRLQGILERYEVETDLLCAYAQPDFGKGYNGLVAKVERLRFADTIVLFTRDTSAEALRELLQTSCALLAASIGRGIPLRGGITAGELCINLERRIVTGSGLIHAHDLETNQKWAGGAFDSTHANADEFNSELQAELEAEGLLVAAKIPVKKERDNLLAIDWPQDLHGTPETVRGLWVEHCAPSGPKEKAKLNDTIRFYSTRLQALSGARNSPSYELAVQNRPRKIWLPLN